MLRILYLIYTLCFLSTSYINASVFDQKGPTLYYWRPIDGTTNFGDMLSPPIVEAIVGHRVATTSNSRFLENKKKNKLLAVGSIMHMAEENDVIWGSGCSGPPYTPDGSLYRFQHLDVRAVRGPMTRKFLLDIGIHCPAVYGDPALLLPRLFPEFTRATHPSREYIIIPHMVDERRFANHPHAVTVRGYWKDIVHQILNSKFVISSSLHGIIVAEAFGVPARYLRLNENRAIFKFADYYAGTGRPNFQYATSVEEALKMGGEPPMKCNLDKLYKAFPRDLFP